MSIKFASCRTVSLMYYSNHETRALVMKSYLHLYLSESLSYFFRQIALQNLMRKEAIIVAVVR